MNKFIRLIFILATFQLVACASRKPLSVPYSMPAPSADTSTLGSNIKTLEDTLNKTKSRVERINVLLNSLQLDDK